MGEEKCALDKLAEKFKREGYAVFGLDGKAAFRIGRALFVIDVQPREPEPCQVLGTTIGLAIALNKGPEAVLNDPELVRTLQELFLPVAWLRIRVFGDPDALMSAPDLITERPDVVLLSGYRFGLDDVVVDGELLHTVHGDVMEEVRVHARRILRKCVRELLIAKGEEKEMWEKVKAKAEEILALLKPAFGGRGNDAP